MEEKKAVSTCVVELGMHRNGTSLTASVLDALGVNMGERFSAPNATNPYGYYEDLDFYDVNVKILREAGGSWCHPPAREDIVLAGAKCSAEVMELVNRKSQSELWGWKEPRTVLTYPLYEPYLPDDVRYVRPTRDREQVRLSLINRHRGKRDDWYKLIDYYEGLIDEYLCGVSPDDWFLVPFSKITSEDQAPAIVGALAEFVGADLGKVGAALDRIHFRR